MEYKVFLIAFAALAAMSVVAVILRNGIAKLEAWRQSNPFTAALAIAAVLAVIIAIFAAQNEALIHCWPAHKVMCFFPMQK